MSETKTEKMRMFRDVAIVGIAFSDSQTQRQSTSINTKVLEK